MGKGSRYRPVDKKKYDENFERIFRSKSAEPTNIPESSGTHQCPDCGKWDWHECRPYVEMVYGRRGGDR